MSVYEEALQEAIMQANGASRWRSTRAYRLWRIIVIKRDKCCVICKSRKGRNAHHVDHASYFPEKRFDPENGVCLCSRCHINYHNNFHRSTRVKCTKYDFDNFVHLSEYMFGVKEKQVTKLIIPIISGGDPLGAPTDEEIFDLLGNIVNEFCIDGSAVMKLRQDT